MSVTLAQLKENQFDFVHDNQKTFRKIMMALAFPGKVYQLKSIPLSISRKELHYILQPFLTLLDFETSYCVYGNDREVIEEIKEYIHINTNCLHTNIAHADFVLCLNSSSNGKFNQLKKGTLYHPNESATIFYLVNKIEYDFFPDSTKLSISGPGVETEIDLYLSDINLDEIKEWITSKNDYPLGVDIYVVSRTGKIIGLPRSVSITSEEGLKWAMSV